MEMQSWIKQDNYIYIYSLKTRDLEIAYHKIIFRLSDGFQMEFGYFCSIIYIYIYILKKPIVVFFQEKIIFCVDFIYIVLFTRII